LNDAASHRTPIKDLKSICHLTALENLESILANGLLSRRKISRFHDVADQEIIGKRQRFGLDEYVPFHFFPKNPFDWRVQHDHPEKDFVIIRVSRAIAKANSFKIIPVHPLSGTPSLLDYKEGFNQINWALMERRDYHDDVCKQVCLGECLQKDRVDPSHFQAILVKTEEAQKQVSALKAKYRLSFYVNLEPRSFNHD